MAFMLPRLYDAHKLLEHMDRRCQEEDEIAELHKIVRYSTSTLIGAVLAGHVPYSMYLPFFDWQQSKLELIFVTIIQYILINIAGLHQICDDTYPVIYIGILRAHLQILLIRVQKLQSLGNADVEDNLKKLKIVIKDHKHLIELYNIIAPVISLTTFVQFFFTAAILSTTLINVTIYTTELSGRVGCLFYIIAAIVQIFPLCYFATGLTVDFSKVTNEIFHTNWFDQDKDYKQTLVFFMQRSQLKMELKAENFFPITLDSFVNLNGSVKPVPPPRDHLRVEKDGRLINHRSPAPPQLPDRRMGNNAQPQQIAQIVEPTLEQLDSIKKYQQ
ncbi:odorant receptor 7a-like [Teleopsis dalmanni]|uniref:odorant receptor 7a-like n=1 Tax=Teleopsis dalmanni TaxID=139649 RepID=UPI0018CD8B3D|nr:odorant receptor 7a-like [Teleopsis dalmanni]